MAFPSDASSEAARAGGRTGPAASLAAAARVAANGLCLAATPTFAVLAVLTAASSGPAMPDLPDMAMPSASPVGGMMLMYILMSVFHAPPWLKLLAGRRSG